jgi:flagella basal body P-ring formation protein FlgA
MTQKIILILLLMASGVDARADDATWESPDRIRTVATDYARQQSSPQSRIETGLLDERLKLPACAEAPQAFSPAGNGARGALSVGVRCTSPVSWTLYIPVRISETRQIMVLNRALNRGEIVTADAISLQERDITTLPYGYLATAAEAVGKTIKRPLTAGSVLTPDALELQRIIKRGQSVTLLSRIGGLEIRAQGTAMADAAQGDRLKVENTSSRRIVEGVVRSADTIEVSL